MEQASGAIVAAVIIGAVFLLIYLGKKLVLRYRWKEHEVLISLGEFGSEKADVPENGSGN